MAPRDTSLAELIAKGEAGLTPDILKHLPRPLADPDREDAGAKAREGNYQIVPDLVKAIQVALLLRQPLLITGEPGVGKTRFAGELALRLELALETVVVKTTTSGRDLLYTFDEVRRFRDAAMASVKERQGNAVQAVDVGQKPLRDYVEFRALGTAILRAIGPQASVEPSISMTEVAGLPHAGQSAITLGELFPRAFRVGTEVLEGPVQTVVLIDELDKAPREAPNDLLDEVESMRFTLSELGLSLKASPNYWPIVIITSNSERSLPDAFLRRCVFHNLRLDEAELPGIIAKQLPDLPRKSPLVTSFIKLFMDLRAIPDLDKRPSTAELVAALAFLVELGFSPDEELDPRGPKFREVASQITAALAKKVEDRNKILDSLT